VPKVQFLHLTVKEYLEDATVWKRLLSRTIDTGFDPHVCLARSQIVAAKVMGPHADAAQSCSLAILYTRRAENSTGQAQLSLAREIFRLWHKEIWNRHVDVDSAGPSGNGSDSWVKLSVLCGLNLYLRANTSDIPEITWRSKKPLLWFALQATPPDPRAEDIMGQSEIIATLLQARQNPNELVETERRWSLWSIFLENYRKYLISTQQLLPKDRPSNHATILRS
jgi:hypothetical protein